MILHLPLVEQPDKPALGTLHRRSHAASSKIRMKQGYTRKPDGIGRYRITTYQKQCRYREQLTQETQQTQTEMESMERREVVVSCSPGRRSLSPDIARKHNFMKRSTEKINNVFNRTRVDWQHNFVGEKYLKKIKEEKKFKKFASCTAYRCPNTKIKAGAQLRQCVDELRQQNTQPLLNYLSRQQSQDQAQLNTITKAKTIKQSKRKRAKTMFNSNSPDKKETAASESDRHPEASGIHYKLEPISPWEDNNSVCMWIRKG